MKIQRALCCCAVLLILCSSASADRIEFGLEVPVDTLTTLINASPTNGCSVIYFTHHVRGSTAGFTNLIRVDVDGRWSIQKWVREGLLMPIELPQSGASSSYRIDFRPNAMYSDLLGISSVYVYGFAEPR